MQIKDIMSRRIICAKTSNSIYEVSKLMKKYNIGFIPIKNEKNLIGVITDRDIIVKAISNNCDCFTPIESYVSKNINCIDLNKEINDALKIMSDNQIKRLIVTKNNKPIGIVSLSDILNNCNLDIISTIKSIFVIQDNHLNSINEIDEFYL